MSPTEFPFSQIKVTLLNKNVLIASSLMFPSKGKPEIYFLNQETEKWIQVDIYAIQSIEFES
jgi:hypothetical protein